MAGSRPSILAVAWLTLWLGLEVFRVAWREGWRPRAPSTLGHALWAQAEDAHAALDAMSATFIQHVEGLAPLLLMLVLRLDKNIFVRRGGVRRFVAVRCGQGEGDGGGAKRGMGW